MNASGSVVTELLLQLFKTNEHLSEVGVTDSQLLSALTLKLGRGHKPVHVKHLIDRELESRRIKKNSAGNYVMNTSSVDDLLCDEESLSGSDSLDTKETDSTTTERTIDSFDVLESQRSEEGSVTKGDSCKSSDNTAKDTKSVVKANSRSQSPETTEPPLSLATCETVEKPVKRRRRRKQYVAIETRDTPDRSSSPESSRDGQNVILSKNTGRRIIRKKTKYDPSEFYLTPLVRKRKESVDATKGKLRRGRPPYKHLLIAAANKKPCTIAHKKSVDETVETELSNSQSEIKDSCPEVVLANVNSSEKPEAQLEKKRTALQSSSVNDRCCICTEYASISNAIKTYACYLCLNIAHKCCVAGAPLIIGSRKWRCYDCLISHPIECAICEKEYRVNEGVMLMCDTCDECFHAECHEPPVKLPLMNTEWRCSLCPRITFTDTIIGGRKDLRKPVGTFAFNACSRVSTSSRENLNDSASAEESNQEHDETPVDIKPELPPIIIKEEPMDEVESSKVPVEEIVENIKIKEEKGEQDVETPKCHRPEEPIPTVDGWSPKQVADYFSDRFGAIVGNAFLSQEIDGNALKLMSRADVTDQLGLHFGLALKVLYYVKKIQLGTNLFHKLWS